MDELEDEGEEEVENRRSGIEWRTSGGGSGGGGWTGW